MRKARPRKALIRRLAFAAAAAVAVLCAGRPAQAEGGEVSLRLTLSSEADRLRHPEAEYPDGGGSRLFVPRLGIAGSYGLTHWLAVGVGASLSMPRDVEAGGVVIQDLPEGDLAGRYLGIMVPAFLTMHFTEGGDWSGEVVVRGGPSFNRWDVSALRTAAGGRLPLEPRSDWYTVWYGGLGVLAEWRPGDGGTLAAGPFASISTAQDLYLGITIEAALAFGAGPFVKGAN
jgi:hypothetical protein